MTTLHEKRLRPKVGGISRASGRSGALALLGALLIACSSDKPEEGNTGGSSGSGNNGGESGSGATGGSGGAGGGEGLVGSFAIGYYEPDEDTDPEGHTSIIGRVYDGPNPVATPMVVLEEAEGCELLKAKIPFCDPPCADGKVCSEGDRCMAHPGHVDVGVVRAKGLGDEFSMSPTGSSHVYQSSALPYRPCEEGAPISLLADIFTLDALCLEPLTIPSVSPIVVSAGQPVEIRWEAPGDPALAHIKIVLDVAPHGSAGAQIHCEVPDSGAFDIPETLVTALVNIGLSGAPSITVSRTAESVASTEPGIRLSVDASVLRAVDTGVITCTDDTDCPPGQVCDTDLSCKDPVPSAGRH